MTSPSRLERMKYWLRTAWRCLFSAACPDCWMIECQVEDTGGCNCRWYRDERVYRQMKKARAKRRERTDHA